MLQITAKTDYGLLMMVALAEHDGGHPVSLRSIAQSRRMPYRFLSQIAIPLRQAGLIEAKEGINGGYRLSRNADTITVGEILRVLEGDLRLVRCHQHGSSLCPSSAVCSLSPFWHRVGKRLRASFDTLMLADLVRSSEPVA